ncbi:MAG: 30S ribosomal protein S15 [Candidatus Paceibacterota bacterium]|jgi:small subunit ribosomal protein S15
MLKKSTKQDIIKKAQSHEKDTGSSSIQVALLTERITKLTEHLKSNKKDSHSRRGLLKMVADRRDLIEYLKKKEPKKFEEITKKFKLKK